MVMGKLLQACVEKLRLPRNSATLIDPLSSPGLTGREMLPSDSTLYAGNSDVDLFCYRKCIVPKRRTVLSIFD